MVPIQTTRVKGGEPRGIQAQTLGQEADTPMGRDPPIASKSNYHTQVYLSCSESVNQLAERVLLTVRDKLAGRVGGIGGGALSTAASSEGLATLETAGQIRLLVRAATSPENLSRMYFGWQAYL